MKQRFNNFNKKGLEKVTLVLLVAMLTVLIAYLFFNKGFAEASNKSVDVTACRASVDRNARLHISGFEFPISINCPARNIKITKSDDSAKRTIADAMADCWYQYGEGKLNLFKDEATYCAVCSFISIESEEPIKGLPAYLLTEQMPDGSGEFYHDYLASYKTSKAEDVLGKIKDTQLIEDAAKSEIEGKSTYAILFVYRKGKDEIEKVANHLKLKTAEAKAGLVIGVGAGSVAGASAAVTLISLGVAAGPVGWAALGVGVTVLGISEAASFFLSSDNVPEWVSYIMLREWSAADTDDNVLKDELECTYFPAELE